MSASGRTIVTPAGAGDRRFSSYGGILPSRAQLVNPTSFINNNFSPSANMVQSLAQHINTFPGVARSNATRFDTGPAAPYNINLPFADATGRIFARSNNMINGLYLDPVNGGKTIVVPAGAGDRRFSSYGGILPSRAGIFNPSNFVNNTYRGTNAFYTNFGDVGISNRIVPGDPNNYLLYGSGDPAFLPRYIDPRWEYPAYPRIYPGTNFRPDYYCSAQIPPMYGSQYYGPIYNGFGGFVPCQSGCA